VPFASVITTDRLLPVTPSQSVNSWAVGYTVPAIWKLEWQLVQVSPGSMLGPVSPIQTTPLVQIWAGALDELVLPAEAPLELPADVPLVLSPEAPLVLAADVPLVPPRDLPLVLPEAPPTVPEPIALMPAAPPELPRPGAPTELPRPPPVPEGAPVLVPEDGPVDAPFPIVPLLLPVVSAVPLSFPGASTPASRPPHPAPNEHAATSASGSRIHRRHR
jgi:hypothetical protein